MRKEDADKIQKVLDTPSKKGVNINYDLQSRDVDWGCVQCGATLLSLDEECFCAVGDKNDL